MKPDANQTGESAGPPPPPVLAANRNPESPGRDASKHDEFDRYTRFSPLRKGLITATVSYCGLMASISSMLVLSAIPEIAADLDTTASMIGLSNALYQVVTAIGPILWGPISRVYGRKIVSIGDMNI